ncbi:MAG: hypothetical protein ABSF70_07585 [Terracidiphilus sp.]|jgi:glucan phosphoethanolaminetransferase (alkaline phosphatase superfamily)
MEITLNLFWVLIAVVFVRLWTRHARLEGASRLTQLAALAMLIAILFPVISVTDDLLTMQNPAEFECCARRNHAGSCPNHIFPAVAALPPRSFPVAAFGFLRFVASSSFPVLTIDNPALVPIQNRPPPTA